MRFIPVLGILGLACALSACTVVHVAGATARVAGTVVSTTAHVTGSVVSTTAHVAGRAVSTTADVITGSGDDSKKRK